MKRFTPEQKNAALNDLKLGKLSREDVAKKHKMSVGTINGLLYSQPNKVGTPMREKNKSSTMIRNLLKRKQSLLQELKNMEHRVAELRREMEFITKQLEHFESFYK